MRSCSSSSDSCRIIVALHRTRRGLLPSCQRAAAITRLRRAAGAWLFRVRLIDVDASPALPFWHTHRVLLPLLFSFSPGSPPSLFLLFNSVHRWNGVRQLGPHCRICSCPRIPSLGIRGVLPFRSRDMTIIVPCDAQSASGAGLRREKVIP